MNHILTLDEHEQNPATDISSRKEYYQRRTAKAILTDETGRVALLHSKVLDYYKLPGGGIKPDEEILDALARELLEETGCEAEITGEIGTITEWRDTDKMKQQSYVYLASSVGEPQAPVYTQRELDEGAELVWADDIDHAITLIESARDINKLAVWFMVTRDTATLRYARDNNLLSPKK